MIDEGMSTVRGSAQQRQAAIGQLLRTQNVDVTTKDADTAFLIELVGGALGFFGLGYLYSGLTNSGIFRLVGGLVALFLLYGVCGTMLTIVTFGFGACLLPLLWIGQVALAYFSANDLKEAVKAAKSGVGGMSGMGGMNAGGSGNVGGYFGSPTVDISNPTMTPRQEEPVYRPFSSDQPASGGVATYDTPSTFDQPASGGASTYNSPGYSGPGMSSSPTSQPDAPQSFNLQQIQQTLNTGNDSAMPDTTSSDYGSGMSSGSTFDSPSVGSSAASEMPDNTQAAYGASSIDSTPPSDPLNQDDDNNPFNPDDLTKKV